MGRRDTDRQITSMAGEFLTVGKLSKRGYQVSVTMVNAKTVDLFVRNPGTDRIYNVQVKTQRRRNNFPLKRENVCHDHIYVFVRLNKFFDCEEFFVVPGKILRADVNRFWGASYRDPQKPSSRPGVNYGPLAPFKDKWDVFDQQ